MSLISSALKKVRKQAGLPPVPNNIPPEQRQFFQAIRENLAVRMGQEGDPLERAVTFKDMFGAGMAKWTTSIPLPGSPVVSAPDEFDYTPPMAPTGLNIVGGFNAIYLDWDIPTFGYNFYAEVWRSPVDALDLNSPNMKMVGTANAGQYIDHLDGDRTVYYYWVRYVKAIGHQLIYGPFNQTGGTPGQITLDPTYVLETLQGQLTESELANELLTPIQAIPGIQTTINGHDTDINQLQAEVGDNTAAIQTKASVTALQNAEDDIATLSAEYTVKLDVNGHVSGIGLANDGTTSEFVVASDAVYFIDPGQSITAFDPQVDYTSMSALRDTQFVFGYAQVEGQRRFAINVPAYIPQLSVETGMFKDLSVTGAKIANATIGGAKIDIADIWDLSIGDLIRSDNFVAGSQGWRISRLGTAEFSNGTFRGHIEADSGYIASTLQIGGTGTDLGELVQMASQGTDTSLFENWIRPNTTLIDGNKIYTGDAYVDTLQIKGRAVTIPSGVSTTSQSASSGTSYSRGSPSPWVTVLSLTISCTGNPVMLACSIDVKAYVSGRSSKDGEVQCQARLLRNGSQLAITISDYVRLSGHRETRIKGWNFVRRDSPGAGNITYRLQVRAYRSDDGWASALARGITALEVKR